MDSEKLDELLNRYWNCETSLEEEEHLRNYFRGNVLSDRHKETAALFRYYDAQKKKALSDIEFASELRNKIRPNHGRVRRLVYNSLRIAAGIAVLVVAVWFVRTEIRQSDPQPVEDTYDDPRMAFEETKKALKMISKSFGTAEEQARKINLFNEAQEEIKEEGKSNL